MSEENNQESNVLQLSDGTSVNRFCMNHFSDLIMNMECIYDLLDVFTKLARLEVVRNEDGFVTDVIQIVPRVDEVLVKFALKNFKTFHQMRETDPSITPEGLLELRRFKLQRFLEPPGGSP